jgi:hypothetical protein
MSTCRLLSLSLALWGLSFMALSAELKSTSGNIYFDRNADGSPELTLNANGLGVFVANPTQRLEVSGNATVSGTVAVGGSSSSSSNLTIYGTLGFTATTLTSNTTLDKSMYLCDNSSANITLTLPAAGNVTGRTIWLKNTVQGVTTINGSELIDGMNPLVLGPQSSQLSAVELISDGSQWNIVSSMGNVTGFKPSSTSNLILWVDAQNSSSITATSGNVSQWKDQSGNNNHLTEGSLYPTYPGNTINGKSTIAFHDQRMVASTLPNDAKLTIFMVVRFSSNPTVTFTLLSTREASSHGFNLDTQANNFYCRSWSAAGYSQIVTIGMPLVASTPFVLASIYDTNLFTNYHNGVKTTAVPGNGNMDPSAVTPFTVGYKTGDTGGQHLYGDVGEIIVYNKVLTSAEVAQVFFYLKAKWGISF